MFSVFYPLSPIDTPRLVNCIKMTCLPNWQFKSSRNFSSGAMAFCFPTRKRWNNPGDSFVSTRPFMDPSERMGPTTTMKKRYRLNLIRGKRSYSVKEVAELLAVHVRTVQSWIKSGLRILEGSRPFLLMGRELKSFLAVETQNRKRPLGPDEFYCFRCRKAVKASQLETIHLNKTMGHDKLAVVLKGFCATCGGKVNRFSAVPKSPDVETPPRPGWDD
jgi:hypothetical protein